MERGNLILPPLHCAGLKKIRIVHQTFKEITERTGEQLDSIDSKKEFLEQTGILRHRRADSPGQTLPTKGFPEILMNTSSEIPSSKGG
jgi:hypothetical protein